MVSRQRTYTRAFKIETVQLVVDGPYGVPQIAEDLGIPRNTLYRWVQQYSQAPKDAFPGKGNQRGEAEQIRQLQRENQRLRLERDILKKAMAIFSKDPK
jgi:transposase